MTASPPGLDHQIISSTAALEEALSRPTPKVVDTMRQMKGDLIILGVGGKMGPSLARMAKRASDLAGVNRKIIGVARFSSPSLARELNTDGIDTITCDLLDEQALDRLPPAPNILYLAGMKFGATGKESLTWAMNTLLPALVCRRFPRSRIVALSTGNVYGPAPVNGGGSLETDALAPVGEYAMSCLGRERVFEHFSRTLGTLVSIIRLNYACDLRYGVLVDLALKIAQATPIDLSIGTFNTIWQGDANAVILGCFDYASTPPFVINLTGPEILSVREASEELGTLLGHKPLFCGKEQPSALLSNARRSHELLGVPSVSSARLIRMVAEWVKRGGEVLNKPTHFESRDGKF